MMVVPIHREQQPHHRSQLRVRITISALVRHTDYATSDTKIGKPDGILARVKAQVFHRDRLTTTKELLFECLANQLVITRSIPHDAPPNPAPLAASIHRLSDSFPRRLQEPAESACDRARSKSNR